MRGWGTNVKSADASLARADAGMHDRFARGFCAATRTIMIEAPVFALIGEQAQEAARNRDIFHRHRCLHRVGGFAVEQ